MRLIDAQNLELKEFTGSDIPPYAILSHTWGDREALFSEWTRRWARIPRLRKPGFSKVVSACKQARRDGIPYLWVDTVCIDKSSSAELSEAINSMFAWYEKAAICYVYLSDVPRQPAGSGDFMDLFRNSRWFTRGWTLQELLAPRDAVFFSSEWQALGSKRALAVPVASITGIDPSCLQRTRRLEDYSIAQRMAWAANRLTTRGEDMAYCLLGIFNIAMPLIYGEGGRKAFRRLQEEIIKVSDDHSILAFDTNLSEETLLAHHPNTFADKSKIHTNLTRKITSPFSITNAGLSMTTPLIQTLSPFWVLAVLNCVEVDTDDTRERQRSQICLPLFGNENKFMRARAPVCLISRPLDASIIDIRDEFLDLSTLTESHYLISNFSKVYSAYGTEMDTALKGFELEQPSEAGFMLTFPRGMAGYKLVEAYPDSGLRSEISFFTPLDPEYPRQPGGLLVFNDGSETPSSLIVVYLALQLSSTQNVLIDWVCRLVQMNPEEYSLESAKDITANMQRQYCLGMLGESRKHFDFLGDTAVVARARFSTLAGEPCAEVVMVELAFDAQHILGEWRASWEQGQTIPLPLKMKGT